jgi:hypothetical protein
MEEFPTIDPKERDIAWSWEVKEYDTALSLEQNIDTESTLEITNLERINANTAYYLFIKKFFDEVNTDYEPEESFDVYHIIEKIEKESSKPIWLLAIKQNKKMYIIDLQKSLE